MNKERRKQIEMAIKALLVMAWAMTAWLRSLRHNGDRRALILEEPLVVAIIFDLPVLVFTAKS